MSTLRNILDKKKSGKIKTVTETTVYSEMLDEDIKIVKRPVSLYMDIITKHNLLGDGSNMENPIPMMNELLFEFCPMFKDVDSVKEAREYYGAKTPMDLPELVFEGDITEMSNIVEGINKLYNVEEFEEDLKN